MRSRRRPSERCGRWGGSLWLPALAGIAAVLAACASLGAADTPPPPPAPAADPAVRDALCDLLGQLRARQLVPDAETELRRIACQALLDAFASGGVVVASDTHSPAPPAPRLTRVESGAGRFGYLQIGAVEAGLKQALADVRDRLPGAVYDGTVVDLRDTAGNDLGAAAECAALIGSWAQPAVVIVNGRTRAAAEVLAASLRTAHGAVILGEPTRGLPYPLRQVRLAGNLDVMLPEVPLSSRIDPLQPDVPTTPPAVAEGSPSRRGGTGGTAEGERDANVRQALDLLTAICTFQQKHF